MKPVSPSVTGPSCVSMQGSTESVAVPSLIDSASDVTGEAPPVNPPLQVASVPSRSRIQAPAGEEGESPALPDVSSVASDSPLPHPKASNESKSSEAMGGSARGIRAHFPWRLSSCQGVVGSGPSLEGCPNFASIATSSAATVAVRTRATSGWRLGSRSAFGAEARDPARSGRPSRDANRVAHANRGGANPVDISSPAGPYVPEITTLARLVPSLRKTGAPHLGRSGPRRRIHRVASSRGRRGQKDGC